MLKGCSRLRRLYSPCASGVHPLYTTRRADPPPDPEELTRAVPATTTAPHSNRKQRIPPRKSPGVVSGGFLGSGGVRIQRIPLAPRHLPPGIRVDNLSAFLAQGRKADKDAVAPTACFVRPM